MFTPQEKAQCVSWFIEMKSDIQTQRNYTTYNTDITLLDFLLWGYIKDVVYHGQDTDDQGKNDLKERINAAVETIDEEILKRTWTEIEYHLDVLCATNGGVGKEYGPPSGRR